LTDDLRAPGRLAFAVSLGLFLALSPHLRSEGGGEVDLSCEARGRFIGNYISPTFSLLIRGPASRTWHYELKDDCSGTLPEPKVLTAKGTYEIVDDLAIFSGDVASTAEETEDRQVRFGVNFTRTKGEIQFNRFFPAGDGRLRYHRKWFANRNGRWMLQEELDLTIPGAVPGESWTVRFTGMRRHRTEDGRERREAIDQTLDYERRADGCYVAKKRGPSWAPRELFVRLVEGRVASVRIHAPAIGELRGFHPDLARVAR
jgi:hypothetical protein